MLEDCGDSVELETSAVVKEPASGVPASVLMDMAGWASVD